MIIIETQAVAPFHKNGFVVACPRTREGVLIDPGDEVDGLLEFVAREDIQVRHILLTHAHVDHVTGVGAAKRALGVPVHLHRDDLFLYEHAVEQGRMFGLRVDPPPPPIDPFYTAGRVDSRSATSRRGRITRRDTAPAACAWRWRRAGERGLDLFVGDTLFAGTIGRTDLPGGDYATLIGSIRTVLFAVRRRCPRVSRPRAGHDHRPGAADESVPAGL